MKVNSLIDKMIFRGNPLNIKVIFIDLLLKL